MTFNYQNGLLKDGKGFKFNVHEPHKPNALVGPVSTPQLPELAKDTVPAMMTPGEFVLTPAAVRHFGVEKLQKMNQMAEQNAMTNPQHFATGGLVAPYDPTNPNKTQNWQGQLDPGNILPEGYSNYTQGYNPTTSQWEYNPNTGAAYSGGDTRGVAAPYVAPKTTPAPAGAPAAGDPNYYKYTSVGGAAYSVPKTTAGGTTAGQTPPPPTNPSGGATRGGGMGTPPPAQGGARGGNVWDLAPKTQPPADVQDFQMNSVQQNMGQLAGGGSGMPTTPGTQQGQPSPDGLYAWDNQFGWQPLTGRTSGGAGSGIAGPARTGGTGQSISQDIASPTSPTRGIGTAGGVQPNMWQGAMAARQNALTPGSTLDQTPGVGGLQGPPPGGGAGEISGKLPPGAPGAGTPPVDPTHPNQITQVPSTIAQGAYSPYDPSTWKNDPWYQWQAQQGGQQLQDYLGSLGRTNSTYGINAMTDFTRGLNASESNNLYNRWFNEDQAQYQRQLALTQLGYGAANTAAQTALQQGNLYGQYFNQAGQLQAQGVQALANQLTQYGLDYATAINVANGEYGTTIMQMLLNQGYAGGQNAWNLGNPTAGQNYLGGYANAGAIQTGGNQLQQIIDAAIKKSKTPTGPTYDPNGPYSDTTGAPG